MKKIFIMAVSAVLLAAGCQKTTIVNPDPEPGMVFTTGMKKLTKAEGTADAAFDGMKNLQAQDFRVWAYTNYTDEINNVHEGDVYDGMKNLNVGYTEVSSESGEEKVGNWSTKKQYYWPGTKKNLLFYAVSGAACGEDLADQEAVVVNATAKTMTISNFTVTPATPNVDLMVADVVDQHQADKQVDLNFRHTLSKVEFLFKTAPAEGMRVLVQSIEVKDLVANGDLAVTVDEANKTENTADNQDITSTTYPVVFTWTPTADKEAAVFTDDYITEYSDWPFGEDQNSMIELAEGGEPVDPTTTEGFDKTAMLLDGEAKPFATWLMVPQTITGKEVTITYIINNRQFKTVFPLDHNSLKAEEETDAKWNQNQYVKYTVTLTPNVISFSPTVTPWDDADNIDMNN